MFNSGIRGRRARDGEGTVNSSEQFVQQQFTVPYVSRFAVTDGSYVDTNDTAADPAGGQTIVLYGNGFRSGATVLVGSTTIGVVTVLDSTRITFSSPALSAGSYTIYVTNSNGGTGILVPGLVYSAMPAFTTAAGSIGSYYETTAISNTIVATEGADPITYTLVSGSLPAGATLSANGVITGTAPVESNSTTYTFTIRATDSELQDSTRQFSLTINTDVVTWSAPANQTLYEVGANIPISNVALSASSAAGYAVSYTANSLPTGITLSGDTISGTPTAEETIGTLLTATAATSTRSATRTISWIVRLGDTYFNRTVLLLNGDVDNTFISDASTNNFLVTRIGDTRPSRFSPYWPGGWSGYFPANGSYLTGSNAIFNISSGTLVWSFECWIYPISSGTFFAIGSGGAYGNSFNCEWGTTTNKFIFIQGNGSSAPVSITSSGTYTSNQWYHCAVTKDQSGVIRLFINGSQQGTQTYTSAVASGTTFVINGRYDNNGLGNTGGGSYISNLRFVTGTALYTANFTPSTTSLTTVANTSLLTLRDAILADDSPINAVITRNGDAKLTTFSPFNTSPHTITANSYSVYFDGSGDSLTLTGNAAFAFGTGDFTVECWINSNSVTSGIFDTRTTVSSTTPLIYSDSTGVRYYVNGAVVITGSVLPLNTWVHIALVRASGTSKLYINGNQSGSSYADSNDYTLTNTVYIGNTFNSAQQTNGRISNFRIVKGTAVYTANFTPSTSALTAISGTSLLTCQANTIIDSNTTPKTITVNGNPNIGIANPFGETVTTISNYTWSPTSYGASAYFDSSGDYINISALQASTLGASDWTIECWFYPTAAKSFAQIIGTRLNATGGTGYVPIVVSYETNQAIKFYSSNNDSSWNLNNATTIGTARLYAWNHVAVVRSGSTVKGYLNGSEVVLNSNYGSVNFSSETNQFYAGGPDQFEGYIADYRLVVGQAVYTTPFVPPTAPLTAIANTSLLTLQSDIGSNSAQFVDQSAHNHLITRSGNASQGSYSPLNPTSWSAYFDGTGDYVSLPSAFNGAMGNGWAGGLHTVECWVYPTTWNSANSYYHGIYGTYAAVAANGRWHITIMGQAGNAAGKLNFSYTTSTSVQVDRLSTSFNIPLNTWTHIAVTIDASTSSSSTVKFFVNGTVTDTFTAQNLSSQTSNYTAPNIGGNMSQYINDFAGYISNFRHSYNSLVYTANFTPPTVTLQPVSTTAILAFSGPRLTTMGPGQFELTRAGDIRIVPFGPHSPGFYTPRGYGIYFDGTGDYLTMPSAASAQFTMGTGDFTIEMWINIASLASTRALFDSNNNGDSSGVGRLGLWVTTGGVIQLFTTTGSVLTSGGSIKVNNWYHVAYSRESGSGRLFVNGVQVNSTYSDSTNYTCGNTNRPVIGINGYDTSTNPMYGVISNLRVVKGSALYTANFTPATSTLSSVSNTSVLTGHTTSITDGSSNALTITVNGNAGPVNLNPFGFDTTTGVTYTPSTMGGSVYFDGSGDDLQTAAGNFIGGIMSAARTFTIECWVYLNAYSGGTAPVIIGDMTPANVTNYWSFGTNGSGQVTLYWYDGANKLATGNTAIPLYNWAHIAVSVAAGTIKLFVNGQIQTITGTSTLTTSTGSLGYLAMGRYSTTNVFNGYVSNLRILNGQALYTTSFLLPTTAPSLTATTSLLLPFNNSGIIDSSGRSVVESVADARVVTSIKKYSTGSYYFDGTGDYLIAAANPMFDLGAGDFTIEAWIYFPTLPSNTLQVLVAYGEADNLPRTILYYDSRTAEGNPGLRFSALNGSGTVVINVNGGGLAGWQAATWHHVAVTRSGNDFKLFRDGVQTGATVTDTDAIPTSATSNIVIGAEPSGGAPLNGYIDDVRITRGYARYTANFTVPSQLLIR